MTVPIVHSDDNDIPSLPPGRLADPTPDQNAPSLAELRERFPRSVLELRLLETLRRMAPLELAPKQLAQLLHVEVGAIRPILYALALVGAIEREARGWYRHRPL
jgi:hypothetical protein